MCGHGVQNGTSFPKDPNGGGPPVHFSSQNNPGGEFETTPQVSGDFLDYDPGREDPNSMPGYRDAEFEIPLLQDALQLRGDGSDGQHLPHFTTANTPQGGFNSLHLELTEDWSVFAAVQ